MAEEPAKNFARIVLGGGLLFAGVSHLTFAKKTFRAQVPDWVPLKKDETVFYSGIAELLLGGGLIFTKQWYRSILGKVVALFFVAVFPGNVSQYAHRRDAFGLNTDDRRLARLFFQPILVYWAWQSTKQPVPFQNGAVPKGFSED
jgi:uncharacterized membrane protein